VAQGYDTFESFSDPNYATPGGRHWPAAAKNANAILEKNMGGEAQDWEVVVMKTSDITPSQAGEDYLNESSRNTAKDIANMNSQIADVGSSPSQEQWRDVYESVRPQDLNPIAVTKDGKIVDGNHRHAAATLNGEKQMLVMRPVGKGTGQIKNLRQAYDSLKAPAGKAGRRAFCGTGAGGGIDPSCGKGSGGGGGGGASPGGGLSPPSGQHNVRIPKDPKRLTVDQANSAMKQMGYEAGESVTQKEGSDWVTKTAYSDSTGKSATLSSHEVKQFVYANHSDPDIAKIRVPKPRRSRGK
jgi:hypothetical protein